MKRHSQAICCVTTQDYLPGLIVLYESVLRHHEIPLYLLTVDINPEETEALTQKLQGFFSESAAAHLHIIPPAEIYGDAVTQMRFYYDAFEFSTACKAGIHS